MQPFWKNVLPMVLLVVFLPFCLQAASDSTLIQKEWIIDGVPRQALIHLPAGTNPKEAPVLFVFHGHGGTMRFSSLANYHGLWPAAIVIYPQGLPTPGHLTDPEGKRSGWQFSEGEQNDRDLKFFDAMLTTVIQEYHGNPAQVFAAGHSNGARFSQLLWAARGDKLTATAASASSALNMIQQLKPKPYLQISGETDPLVSIRLQQASFNAILKVNHCTSSGQLEKHFPDGDLTRYPSTSETPSFLLLHHGGHTITTEGPSVIVNFFQGLAKP